MDMAHPKLLHVGLPVSWAWCAMTLARLGLLAGLAGEASPTQAGDVFARFRMDAPANSVWYARLGGYIHREPWYLPGTVWPRNADKDKAARLPSGQFSPWFDVTSWAGKRLHGRLNRAGGVAEFPNVTVDFISDVEGPTRTVVIELATAPDEQAIVKRFEESFAGSLTSFLVSPTLKQDAESLETASQMTARRLAWARERAPGAGDGSGGKRVTPRQLFIQTQFWSPQRPELNLQEAEVLWLLGFNLVGNQMPEVRERYQFLAPGGHHWVEFGPALTREGIEKQIRGPAEAAKPPPQPTLFGFSDEIACRPPIGEDAAAKAHFHAWLLANKVSPKDLGVKELAEVVPIESPLVLRERQKENRAAANRVFLYTTRFRQESATERLKWLTESFHQHAAANLLTTTLVADHPYFAGSGLGMGMDRENPAWGGYPLALDWFSLARRKVVDMIGIEDWMGLQYMYGPSYTWEGFQLMGFQAAIFRSASRGDLPIMAWITPSDETNLRLKTASALCQGAKHFFYWTYGPTATSTENYWSDLRSAYDGIVAVTRQLAAAEHIIAPGHTRPTRVALLYSLSSDLWQPFGYVHMLERRLTYFSLIHDQYLVDMLTEQDIEDGRRRIAGNPTADYDVLYATDPCIAAAACERIRRWVNEGGRLYASCAAGSRNEFGEEADGLSDVFGIQPRIRAAVQPGRYHIRGALNDLKPLDTVRCEPQAFDAVGLKVAFTPTTATVAGTFADGSPAVAVNRFGKGSATYVGTCPGISYARDARFVPRELKEKWPAAQRAFINRAARESGAPRLVELSHPVVEAGVFDASPETASPAVTALVLANFTYEPIPSLRICLRVKRPIQSVRSVSKGPLPFTRAEPGADEARAGYKAVVQCEVSLGLNDIILFE